MHSPERRSGRVAALDLGEVRTGVAISDSDRVVARPVEVLSREEIVSGLRRLVEDEGVEEVVVGVPKTLGGEVGEQARRALADLERLRAEFPGVYFVEWDERLTTRIAAASGSRKGGKKGRRPVDDVAAAQMLQEYLGAGRSA